LKSKHHDGLTSSLTEIPKKRYFAIREASALCGVKPHVLRYWEKEFPQLTPKKRAGNRRYYQTEDIVLVRRIRSLLYDQEYTISGARSVLKLKTPNVSTSPGSSEAVGEPLVRLARAELEIILDILQGRT
jgi:DNA-binding transcriptional MerR regulator